MSGGFYVTKDRICLGHIAITWLGVEVDELMHSFVNECELQRENAELKRKLKKARAKARAKP